VTGAATGALGSVTGALGSVNGALSGIAGAANSVLTGAVGAASSLLPNSTALNLAQTGLQGIPGGQNALSLVVDKATSLTNNIPGAAALGGIINNNAAGLLSGAGSQVMSAAADASKLLGGVTGGLPNPSDLLSKLQSNFKPDSGSLAGLAASVLPPALANQLSSALSSITANNPNQLQVPTVAVGTVNRGSVDSQLSSILGNPKIPAPSYGSLASFNSNYEKEMAKIQDRRKRFNELAKRVDEQKIVNSKAQQAFEDAEKNLPEGDPQLVVLNTTWKQEYAKYRDLVRELINFD
jgi:hypothetical protein